MLKTNQKNHTDFGFQNDKGRKQIKGHSTE